MAELSNFRLAVGDIAPPFDLPATDGKRYRLEDFASSRFLLVVFSCNHCPYAQAWEGRLIELAREYAPRGLAAVDINSNDSENYPDDSFDRMKERAKLKQYPFPYLRDESQEVARTYGALVTPHAYLFDTHRRLIFQGRIDDNWEKPHQVKHRYLRDALEDAFAGTSPRVPTTSVLGCSVKWKPENL
jgi:peroxiredoxin